ALSLLFYFILIPPPPSSTLFPYTTLFRSHGPVDLALVVVVARARVAAGRRRRVRATHHAGRALGVDDQLVAGVARGERAGHERRSEEHTSELQSQSNLVCRLLLEKKKYIK